MLVSTRTDVVARASSSPADHLKAIPLETLIVTAIVLIGGLLRFTTLTDQSFWSDEASTSHLTNLSFGSMFNLVSTHEANPPLYFVLVWAWAKVFGSDEFGLRSLSALAGTAVIPIAYLCGRELVSKGAGIVAASLAALSPFMIWYSQEGTEYMLLAMLSGASLLYFARALREPSSRNILWWGVFSALALLTHFFAGFLVAPEALWLLWSLRRRAVVIATAGVAAVELSLAPLLFGHANNSILGFFSVSPLRIRVEQVPVAFALGTLSKSSIINQGLLGAAVVTGVVILLVVIGADKRQLRGAVLAASMAACVLLVPLLIAVLGRDYYIDRALIPAWIPLAVLVGAACTARRTLVPGMAFAAGVLAVFVYAQTRIDGNFLYQRPDWRGVAHALGRPVADRAIVAYNGNLAVDPLGYYLPRVRWGGPPPASVESIGEVDVIASVWQSPSRSLPAGAELLTHKTVSGFAVDRFRVAPSWHLTSAEIAARAGELVSPAPPDRPVLVQTTARP